MIALEASEVVKRYANHLALNKVSISVPQQSIYGLLGPNGAGKTSLIRIINQITGPDEGWVQLNGQALAPHHSSLIGYLPEERGLYKKMKVGEQAMYLAQLKGVDKVTAHKRLSAWFEKFDIGSWWNRKVEELSKGMQQKVQFIVTVIHEPSLLIFDEPFSGFDPVNVSLLKSEILRLRDNGATILFSTHNMESVEELCDHIALINAGEKILDGTVQEIKRSYRSHTFDLVLSGLSQQAESILPAGFELLSATTNQFGETSIRIKSSVATNSNQLLGAIMPRAGVVSFQEVLPSMNDIFIEKVRHEKPAQHGSIQ